MVKRLIITTVLIGLLSISCISKTQTAAKTIIVKPTVHMQTTISTLRPLKVGAFYFTGWDSPERWSLIKQFGDRDPVLGYYRDDSPKVQDWHIRQATQHGISFWVFDLYYDHRTGNMMNSMRALDAGFLRATLCNKMDFALMWCNEENRKPDYTKEQLLQLARTVGTRYLSRKNYLRTSDGRNVFGFTRPDRLISEFGVDGTRDILEAMNNEAKQWGGLFFICIKNPTAGELTELKNAGFNASTLYSYDAYGLPAGQKEAPYDSILPTIEPMYRKAAGERVLPVIPMVSPGWDSRPWYSKESAIVPNSVDHAIYRTGSTPKKFEQMCKSLKAYVDPGLNMMMVGTWNEFGEGSYIEPTKQRGCTYLDAMERVFFPGKFIPHTVAVPTAKELTQLDFANIPTPDELTAPKSGNLIVNPGFERDFGWTYFDSSPILYSTNIVHSGKRAISLAKALGGLKVMSLIEPEAGKTYNVSAWVYGKVSMVSALFGKDGYSYQPIVDGGQEGSWQKLEGKLTINDPKVSSFDLEFVPVSVNVIIDDVSVSLNDGSG
ncbi:glycoside hydrolase family 99-like domain-containing protein [uncultured Desulfobulbus sp.]|uniref:glycoside hydrolase family 99-like domain-containing protein n=1 Tax=uncultured Desulfobulbus sp. TaxID=239745 RepID=UPI0029C83DFB|nr:glycoside hydrolase family 99-like domain-containing protein [uncultured Desulfobulbus sp.]